MKHLTTAFCLSITIVLTLSTNLLGGETLSKNENAALLQAAKKMQIAFLERDLDSLVDAMPPEFLGEYGGREEVRASTEKMFRRMDDLGIKLENVRFGIPSEIHSIKNGHLCFIPKSTDITLGESKKELRGFLIAVRAASSEKWLFIDGAGTRRNPDMIWDLFPGLSRTVKFPELEMFYDEDRGEKKDPQAIRTQLIGKWHLKKKMAQFQITGITDYGKDMLWRSTGNFVGNGLNVNFELEGTWSTGGTNVNYAATKSNVPEIIPVGEKWSVRIVKLTSSTFQYIDEDGYIISEKREINKTEMPE